MAIKIVTILLGSTLVLVLACGGAPAAPDPTATSSPATPAADTAPTTAPTAPVANDTAQPTSTPQMAAPPAEVEVHPGKLTVMVPDLANERFDYAFSSGGPGLNYASIVHGFVTSTNENMELTPGLATDWKLSEDGLTWNFTIREGMKFHDGSDLTAEDVRWSFEHIFGPQAVGYATANVALTMARSMGSIELSEPNIVSITSESPIPILPLMLAGGGGGYWFAIMPGRDALRNEVAEQAYENKPIGAGFMRLQQHIPAQVMQFERFDEFYQQPKNGFLEDKRVNFQSLDMFLVPEEATRVAALRSGEADIIPVSIQTRQQVEAGGGHIVFGKEGVILEPKFLGCWTDPNFPCADKRVRQALDYALDKELFRDRLYGGTEVFEIRGWRFGTPSTIGYTPELDPWPFDPDKARQLLAEAGYPNGEGFGTFIINTFPSSSLPFQVEAAQLAADMWRRELGLDVEVRVTDSVGMDQKERNLEMQGQMLWRDNEVRLDAGSSALSFYGDPERPDRLHNDPELQRLVQETVQILDADERAEAYKKLFLRLRDESYQLGMGYANIPWGVGPRVLTWEPSPLSLHPSALHTITLK
jgi:peptide/nickel transport system substrate-binding protein